MLLFFYQALKTKQNEKKKKHQSFAERAIDECIVYFGDF
jgi:hypothetical protein